MKYAKLTASVVLMPAFWAAFLVSGHYTTLYSLYRDVLTYAPLDLAGE